LRPCASQVGHVLVVKYEIGRPPEVGRLPHPENLLQRRRRPLIEAACVPSGVLKELRILRRHRRVFGVVDEDAVSPCLQQYRLALAEPHCIRAIGGFCLDLRAALALALPLFDDDRPAIGDDVSSNRMRPAVDNGAESALLLRLPLYITDFRAGDDLLRRRIHAAECRADGPSPCCAARPANHEAYNGADDA